MEKYSINKFLSKKEKAENYMSLEIRWRSHVMRKLRYKEEKISIKITL